MKQKKPLNLSKYNFTKMYGNDYHLHNYECEVCGKEHNFYEMSSCDRCQRFVCDDCSEAVANRDHNPFEGYDFLCSICKEELENDNQSS